MILRSQQSTLFPYTTLFRSVGAKLDLPRLVLANGIRHVLRHRAGAGRRHEPARPEDPPQRAHHPHHVGRAMATSKSVQPPLDRKSTRLNSSHTVISYAVFCL